MKNCFLGIDVGTTGIRASVIDEYDQEILTDSCTLPAPAVENNRCEAEPLIWQQQLHQLLNRLCSQLAASNRICAVSIDGTSSTVIACDKKGHALGNALMYNDQQSSRQAALITSHAPVDSAAQGASSSLAKALTLLERYPQTACFCHQADWLTASLSGDYHISDENNCLKMGYDIEQRRWPEWIFSLGIKAEQLPQVQPPGTFIRHITGQAASKTGLPEYCQIIAGTTDSIAALIATGASHVGDAVTSLGSTLVLKLISDKPVFNAEYGIYSHRLGSHWLVGGASNAGGRVLEQYFSRQQMQAMTQQLKPETPTGLDYYPLPAKGERFPVNDCQKQPRLTPRPDNDATFFQAMLEGLGKIEHQGYKKLETLGAGKVRQIFTCGGGDNNPAWRKIRESIMAVSISSAPHTQASYGSALLAKQGWQTMADRG